MVGDLFDIKCYLEISQTERIRLAKVVPFQGELNTASFADAMGMCLAEPGVRRMCKNHANLIG